MKEFVDEMRDVTSEYYDIVGSLTAKNIPQKITELEGLVKRDPYFLDSYGALADIYDEQNEEEKAERLRSEAYEKALELIVDKSGKWPQEMLWGWLENRHVIRAFLNRGVSLWYKGRSDDAYAIFEKLLATNSNDNPGVRFFMLAILEKMPVEEFDNRFDKGGCWDDDICEWFNKNVHNHDKEFGWWLKIADEML